MTDTDRAWGWVAHLRGGGTTRWRLWTGESSGAGGRVPGAQRLEVLRRLNEVGATPPLLVDAVLTTTSLGRGQQELRLEGSGPPEPYGPPRVAPAEIPVGELRRVATGALADLARRVEPAPAPTPGRLARWRPARVRLVGDPLLVAAYADQLTALGRPLGGRSPEVVVLLAPLDLALADLWARRVLLGGRVRWLPWVERYAGRQRLPEAGDPALVAARWAARLGRDRVHLCGSSAGLAELTGVRLTTPPRLTHPALEAVRATSTMLHLALPEERLPDVLRGVVVPWVAAADDPSRAVGGWLPPEARSWVAGQADRVHESLRIAGYPVHGGGADVVLPVTEPVATRAERLTDDAVLEVLLAALQRAARTVIDRTVSDQPQHDQPQHDQQHDQPPEQGGRR